MVDAVERIRIGHVSIRLEKAIRWVKDYADAEANAGRSVPYAFPAYDRYEEETNDPLRLSDADFMAPTLLNVPVKLRAYYSLQRIRGPLENALANPDLAMPLVGLDDVQLQRVLRPLYAVLDDRDSRPAGVQGTLLSKVLHRKRPETLVLHDTWVNQCYVSEHGPVLPAKDRSWAAYMVSLSAAIRDDLGAQTTAFKLLRDSCGAEDHLTDLRLLDIVAWSSKGATTA